MHSTILPLALLILSPLTHSLALPNPQFKFPSSRQLGGSTTANELASGPCKDITYIFARGTGESGNMGNTVGPALATEIKARFGGAGSVTVQGVDYPASISGTFGGSVNPKGAAGAKKMAELVKQAKTKCSGTKVVIAGYSQGAQQVHGALLNLSPGEVDAAVTFGDPLQRQAFQNIAAGKTKIFCNEGDSVCNNSFVITAAHLSYTRTSIKPAGDFLVAALG